MIRSLGFLLAAGALAAGSSAAARPADRAAIEGAIRDVIEAGDGKDMSGIQGATWPDGHFSVRSFAPDARPRRRRWGEHLFGGIGVNTRSRITRLGIRITGDRATAWVHQAARIDYGMEFSGVRSISHNLVRLERRGGEWRVLDWDRRVRQTGSDSAWHRRNR